TMGAAPEVPPNGATPVPLPATADTDAPGAPISGLIRLRRLLGPRDDEPVTCPTRAMPLAGSNVTWAPAALSFMLVDWLAMYAGTVGQRSLGQTPSVPSNGSPGAISPMIPIAPPPAAMFAIFAEKLQVPRLTRTILPVSVPAAKAAQPSRLPPL